ncbi:MAG TPA: hypothetical protein VLL05_06245 [Terriglobales bacterium]|nr:hypothetical protein [Terriglobales bacterium]
MLLVDRARRLARSGRAMFVAFTNLKLRWPRLPELLHQQAQIAIADLAVQNSPHHVALRRPQMQQALVYSPDTEYFASARSKMRAPSSSTMAWRDPPRNSSSTRLSDSAVIRSSFQLGGRPSVIAEHGANGCWKELAGVG